MNNQSQAIRVAAKKDLKDGAVLCVQAGEKKLALIQDQGKLYAVDNSCPHGMGPLCEGGVMNGVVTCPWHGAQFRIDNGNVVRGPAQKGVRSYPVEVRGEDVYVIMN